MRKYVCTICGYVYDESSGVKWEDLPEEWLCPLCGATKSEFKLSQEKTFISKKNIQEEEDHNLRELSYGEMSALCTNLSKGCSKQYREEESELFNKLAIYFEEKNISTSQSQIKDLSEFISKDLEELYPNINIVAESIADRGSLRALVWGEKVTRMLNSIIARYENNKTTLLDNTKIYVCDICGFVYIGDDLPEICPVCKVPNNKINEVIRG